MTALPSRAAAARRSFPDAAPFDPWLRGLVCVCVCVMLGRRDWLKPAGEAPTAAS